MPALYQYPLKPAAWNERDSLLFSCSIGCSETELQYLYELSPNFTTFPTFPSVLTFKHDYTSTSSFEKHFTEHLTPPRGCIPGFPALDIARVVDGERTLEVLKTLPTSSKGRRFAIRSSVVQVWDKGPGKSTIVQTDHLVVEMLSGAIETPFTRMSEIAVFMGQGGWSGPNGPKYASSPSPPESTAPTATYEHSISPTAHLLYRLNGDYNPLHATHVKEAVVQPTPIMHGLYSWNVASRIITSLFGTDLRFFRASFVSPVRLSEVLCVQMWRVGKYNKCIEIRFVVKIEDKIVLSNGVALVHEVQKEAKL